MEVSAVKNRHGIDILSANILASYHNLDRLSIFTSAINEKSINCRRPISPRFYINVTRSSVFMRPHLRRTWYFRRLIRS